MAHDRYQQIQRQIESFPPLPATASRVLEVTANPESSAADLMEVVQADQSICTAILKVANSPLFGQSKQVSSLEKAITVLGFEEVQNIVLGKTVLTSFAGLTSSDATALNRFWEHSLGVGLAAQIIAVHLGRPTGRFFIAGLIHDIGKLALLLCFPDEYPAASWLGRFTSAELHDEEQKLFGITHEKIAGKLLESWNFPLELLLSIGFHHNPENAPHDATAPLIVQLADVLAHLCGEPALLNNRTPPQAITALLPTLPKSWQQHGLPWDEVAVESWLAWLKIDTAHGSSILRTLMATR